MSENQNIEQDIAVILNGASGTNSKDKEAIDKALNVFGLRAKVYAFDPENMTLENEVKKACNEGARVIVAAGGDGTILGVANALKKQNSCAMGVLPLGTFNYFARGIGIGEDVEEAARVILKGYKEKISLARINGNLFLNNASLGIYPSILKERESVYKKWGRSRWAAYASVVSTFLQFQKPMTLSLAYDNMERTVKTPLLFAARSAYQLNQFDLKGSEDIHNDKMVIFVGTQTSRVGLFASAWRLVRGRLKEDLDYETIITDRLCVKSKKKRLLIAFDGEKKSLTSPYEFDVIEKALEICVPEKDV